MATLSQTLQIILTATDQTAGAIGSVSKQLGDLAGAGERITQPLADATASVLKFQTGLLAAGAAMAIVSANEAQKFEISFREIATLINQPVENLNQFKADILTYAQSSTQSLDQIIRSTYDAISAGVDYEKSLDAVRQSEILSVAGKTELGSANRVLNQILAAYAETNLTASQAADGLFTTVRTGVTTMPDLAQSIGGVISIAAQGGVSFEELGAAVATLTKTQETAEAITSLKGVITGIISPSAEAKDAAEALGIEFSASSLKANGLQGILQLIIEKTGGSTDKIAELFGNVRGLTGVLGLATSEGSRFADNLQAQQNAAGAAQEAFAKFNGILDTGVDALKVLAIQLGQPVMQAFINAKGEITNLTNALTGALQPGGPLSGLGDLVGQVGADVESTLKDIAKNLPGALEKVDFSGFLKSLESLWSAIGRLLRVDELRTEDGLAQVIQTLVDLLTQTTTFTEKALESLGPFLDKIFQFIEALSKIDPAQIALLGEFGGYALAANVALGALGGAFLAVNGAMVAAGPLIAAVKVEMAALAAVAGTAAGGGLIAALGKAGLAGAVGLLTFELGKAANLNDVLAPDRLFGEGATVGTVIADLVDSLRGLGKVSEDYQRQTAPLPQLFLEEAAAAREVRERVDELLDARAKEAALSDGVAESIKRLTDYWKEQGYAYDAATGALTRLNTEQGKFADLNLLTGFDNVALDAYVDGLGQVVTTYEQVGGGTVKATGAFAEVKDKTKEAAAGLNELVASGKLTADQLIDVTKNANDFKAQMEEIASNERIKTIEATVSLNIARLETDAERVQAVFASIDTTIGSTGDLLGNLFGLLGDADTYARLDIQEQIDLENKRRQEALDIQKKLAEAEIARIEAQTRQLNRGDPWIRIDGTGLAPQLEAFMFEILKAIRTQVNAEFSNFLLGVA